MAGGADVDRCTFADILEAVDPTAGELHTASLRAHAIFSVYSFDGRIGRVQLQELLRDSSAPRQLASETSRVLLGQGASVSRAEFVAAVETDSLPWIRNLFRLRDRITPDSAESLHAGSPAFLPHRAQTEVPRTSMPLPPVPRSRSEPMATARRAGLLAREVVQAIAI